MKQVTLKSMTLENFRGHKHLAVEFGQTTTISGDNRLGKSTVFDAFVWLLFGKDQFDRKDHEIIPIIDGKRIERVDSEVCAVLDVDGREMSLKRVLHQKWVRRRGTTEEVFDGCDTVYFMNDVPLKASEFKARVDMMIEETVFKLITNPSTFLGLHWTKQREFLFQLVGTISDAEIAATDPRFAQLLDMVNGKPLIEFKKEISARKKKLQEELEKVNPKVDQTTKLMPQERDFATIEADIRQVDADIKAIDEQIADKAKSIRAQYDDIQSKQAEINAIKTKQQDLVNAKTTESQQAAFKANSTRVDAQNALAASKRRLDEAKKSLDEAVTVANGLNGKIATKQADITRLRDQWATENAKEYQAKSGCLVCPVFGHDCADPSASAKHSEAQDAAKLSFLKAKDDKLDAITDSGKAITAEVEQLKIRALEASKYASEIAEHVEKCHTDLSDCEKAAAIPAVVAEIVIPSQIAEWVELGAKIKAIEETICTVEAPDNKDLNEQKAALSAKRDELKKALSDRENIVLFTAEIERLKTEASDYAQQIADIERTEFTMADFNKVKIDECDRRINGMFQIVKFQLFDKTIEGNEFECCIPTNKAGVPISATNTAEQINAGLDVIGVLSRFYNVTAPVFVDRSESVNRFHSPDETQMIFVRVTKEPVLTVTNN